jgi:hypothetical protein
MRRTRILAIHNLVKIFRILDVGWLHRYSLEKSAQTVRKTASRIVFSTMSGISAGKSNKPIRFFNVLMHSTPD